jgi:hypothetical protein
VRGDAAARQAGPRAGPPPPDARWRLLPRLLNLHTLALRDCTIGASEVNLLVSYSPRRLRHVTLSGACIVAGAEPLAAAWRHVEFLVVEHPVEAGGEDDGQGCASLLALAAQLPALCHLELRRCRLGPVAQRSLAACAGRLRSLRLARCQLCGSDVLAAVQTSNLQLLNVVDCSAAAASGARGPPPSSGAAAAPLAFLAPALENLALCTALPGCLPFEAGSMPVCALPDALGSPLTSLSLGGTDLRSAAAAALCAARLPLLEELSANCAWLDAASVRALLRCHWPRLRRLRLSHAQAGAAASGELAAAAARWPALESLELRVCSFAGPAMASLAAAPFPRLSRLHLFLCCIQGVPYEGAARGGAGAAKDSFGALAGGSWPQLRELLLDYCRHEERDAGWTLALWGGTSPLSAAVVAQLAQGPWPRLGLLHLNAFHRGRGQDVSPREAALAPARRRWPQARVTRAPSELRD